MCLFVLLVAVPVLLWSVLNMAPLGGMHWAAATVVVGVKTVAWAFVARAAVGMVLALRICRAMRAKLATIS